jgi:hypothetical protein
MTEKRMLVVDSVLLDKIDANRGDMSRNEFLSFLIDTKLGDEGTTTLSNRDYISKEEFQEFSQGMKDLLRHFLDFFISYGMELGEEPKDHTFSELVQKLQSLSSNGGKPKSAKTA